MEKKRLETFEMWVWRRLIKISWTGHVTNKEVLERIKEKRSILATIEKRQRNWIGKMLRSDNLLKDTLEGRMRGRRARGKQRQKWLDNIIQKGTYAKIKRDAQDRDRWRHMNHGPA